MNEGIGRSWIVRGALSVALILAVFATLSLGPSLTRSAEASPPRSEGCYYPHYPGEVYNQECVGVSTTGSERTALYRAEQQLANWERAYSVSCTNERYSTIPRDGGKVEGVIYATCYPFA